MQVKQSPVQVEPCHHAVKWVLVVALALAAAYSCAPQPVYAKGVDKEPIGQTVLVCDAVSDVARSTFIVVGMGFDVKGKEPLHKGIMQMVLDAVRAGASTPDKVGAHVYNECMKDRV